MNLRLGLVADVQNPGVVSRPGPIVHPVAEERWFRICIPLHLELSILESDAGETDGGGKQAGGFFPDAFEKSLGFVAFADPEVITGEDEMGGLSRGGQADGPFQFGPGLLLVSPGLQNGGHSEGWQE